MMLAVIPDLSFAPLISICLYSLYWTKLHRLSGCYWLIIFTEEEGVITFCYCVECHFMCLASLNSSCIWKGLRGLSPSISPLHQISMDDLFFQFAANLQDIVGDHPETPFHYPNKDSINQKTKQNKTNTVLSVFQLSFLRMGTLLWQTWKTPPVEKV